jgi:hypothetical protein
MGASQLIEDLSHVPTIIGALGLSIADAQKALDANYLDGLERLLGLAKMMLDPAKATPGAVLSPAEAQAVKDNFSIIHDMLMAFAPSRYQFTETTLDVKLDLAQSINAGASIGLGLALGAVSLNAAFTVGYAFDYRAAAECRTVINAIPASQTVFSSLLDRAASLSKDALTLPDQLDKGVQQIIDQNARILEKVTGVTDVKKVTGTPPPAR